MITFYARPTCPFCAKVRTALDGLDIDYIERDIADDEYRQELLDRGGEVQVPFIVDEDHSVEMYESDDIVAYLEHTYGDNTEQAA